MHDHHFSRTFTDSAGVTWVPLDEAKPRLLTARNKRVNHAWALVLEGEMSRRELEEVAGISEATISIMRRAKRALGKEAGNFPDWDAARQAYQQTQEN